MKENKNNAFVQVVKENGFEHIYITINDFKLQVRPIKYRPKLMYKLMKECEGK